MWTFVVIGAAVSALVCAAGGFLMGASVADERAGEAAMWLAAIGAGVGAVLGGALGALAWVIVR